MAPAPGSAALEATLPRLMHAIDEVGHIAGGLPLLCQVCARCHCGGCSAALSGALYCDAPPLLQVYGRAASTLLPAAGKVFSHGSAPAYTALAAFLHASRHTVLHVSRHARSLPVVCFNTKVTPRAQ
jgi:hypothetical protein